MPGYRLPYSLCTVVDGGDGSLHLIDSGVDEDDAYEALESALRGIGRSVSDIASVTLTHMHRDHAALSRRVREVSGATVRLHRADAEAHRTRVPLAPDAVLDDLLAGVPAAWRPVLREYGSRPANREFDLVVDEELTGGETLALGSRVAHVHHMPGHTRGSVAVELPDDGIVCTGDHLLPLINPGTGLSGRVGGENPLSDYLRSLDALEALAARDPERELETIPGHGYRFTGLAARCAEVRSHHETRAAEVRSVLEEDPEASVWDVASRLHWTAGWDGLDDFSRYSAVAQTAMHLDRVR